MSWFAELAGKAESLLNNIDEQTGVALRSHNVVKSNKKHDSNLHSEPWQKRRTTARSTKKVFTAVETKSNNVMPSRNASPASQQSRSPAKERSEPGYQSPTRRSPTRKSQSPFNMNRCPRTMVGDMKDVDDMFDTKFVSKQRRYSLPEDVELMSTESMTNKLQNLEVENAMLKNELNVMNREVTELLHRLRKTEDGNVVNGFTQELTKVQTKCENSEIQNQRLSMETESQSEEIGQLKYKINELVNVVIVKQNDKNESLETEICILKERNQDLDERLKQLNEKSNESRSVQRKLENELRHAQSLISDLQTNLDKSVEECRTLEKDWETYKLRVKGMLNTKDNEIKALQEGLALSEDTKSMMEQLEELKQERESLSEAVSRVREECGEMKTYIEQLESKRSAAERVVTALRDALRDERDSKNRAEGQCLALSKELKSLQHETAQTIASLRTSLRDKEAEINNLRNSASTDTSALNVADYDVMQESLDHDRIHYLTETLVQKQGKIDSLLADNNVLRIQLEKLESKYKSEVIAQRANAHVVHLQDGDRRPRSHAPTSALSNMSLRIGVMMRRYPVFRMFIVIYMICLHFWVLTVLLTSTPEGHMSRHVKS